jgi:hypothetical protein
MPRAEHPKGQDEPKAIGSARDEPDWGRHSSFCYVCCVRGTMGITVEVDGILRVMLKLKERLNLMR